MATPHTKARQILAFVPSGKNYGLAIEFYRDLGFSVEWKSDELAVMEKDGCRFFLQNYQNKIMQKNFMMNLDVEDLDAWWEKIQASGVAQKYEGVKIKAPALYPWGKKEIHIVDPAGVLWHIAVPA